jgi:hypothetical protein
MICAAAAWFDVVEPGPDAGSALLGVTLVSAIVLGTAIAVALRGHRRAAAVLAGAGAIAYVSSGAAGVQAGAFASACIVAVGGLLASTPVAPAGRRTAAAIGAIPAVALPLALTGGVDATAVEITFSAIAAAALLACGWFDPRLAAAATTLVFSRLLASGFDELGQALAVLAQQGSEALLVRWMLMAAGVLGAWFATQRSINRLSSL